MSSTIGLNYSSTDQVNYGSDRVTNEYYSKEENNVAKTGYNLSTSYNAKINSRLFVKIGIQDELIGLNLFYRTKQNINAKWKQIWDYDSYTV